MDAVFRPGVDAPFSPTAFDDLEIKGSAEDPILLDKEGDQENTPPTTPVSERTTLSLRCWENVHLEQK